MKKVKPKLIFMYNSLSTGGGLTFLKKFGVLDNSFDVKYFSFNNLKATIPREIKRGTVKDLFLKESILVANSVITALILLCVPSSKTKFYVTHGYANAYNYLPIIKKLLLKLVFYLGKNRVNFIACGEDEKLSILHLRPDIKVVSLVHNSVDVLTKNTFTTAGNNEKLLFIGRISRQKGVDLLLDALDSSTIPVSLTIAGPVQKKERGYAKVVEERVCKLNKKGHKISLLGPIDLNIFNFDDYKCCILPSRYEGFAFLPLELSKLKVPYILSNCLGHDELLVSHLDTMYSFDIHNNEALKKLIEKILTTDINNLVTDFEKIHTARLARYTDDEFISKYRKLFLECA